MNFQSTQINYKQNYPFVLTGEVNQSSVSKSNNQLYSSVCQQDNLESQYKLQAVTGLPELACPNASGRTTSYSMLNEKTCTMFSDNQWWYTNPTNLNFSHEQSSKQERCIPQFQNSIQVCSPRDCALNGNPDNSYLHGFECNKMWNNNTKRTFINNRK
jgi:hypothetical protein